MNNFVSMAELEASLNEITCSPHLQGAVEMIVCRPQSNQRQQLAMAELTIEQGMTGDNWDRATAESGHRFIKPETQLALMNSRVIAAIAVDKRRWPLAGDQFYVDLNLSKDNTPAGTRLKIGSALIEVTAEPHLGCRKFAERFGKEAVKFTNSSLGQKLNLRGVYARVIEHGIVDMHSSICKVEA